MAPRVFIDGHAGTIGLRIRELLHGRSDLSLLEVSDVERKDPAARKRCLDAADVAILCLPDEAAREAVAMADNRDLRFIDGSTAHRVDPGWVYGLPEAAPGQRERIAGARLVSNPGCYPTGVILLLRPLVDAGLLSPTTPISVHALSGYTGGGRAMIERWEAEDTGLQGLPFPAPYAADRRHKHVPEMTRYSGLSIAPHFVPAVGPYRCGMRVQIPLHVGLLHDTTPQALHATLTARYTDEPFIDVVAPGEPPGDEQRFDPRACNGTNRVVLRVLAHPDGHALLMAIFDNLGKGASGAAVQSLNLMLGMPEDRGLSH